MQLSAAHAHAAHHQMTKQAPSQADTPLHSNAYRAILNSSLPDHEKEPARLAQEILTLLVGGSATSARVMTRTTYHLASEPALLRRLRDELETVMPDPSMTPPLEQLETLPFLVRFPPSWIERGRRSSVLGSWMITANRRLGYFRQRSLRNPCEFRRH